MMICKTNEQIELMRQSALLVSKTLSEVAKLLKPGLTTLEIDKMIGEFVKDHKAIPSFLHYNGYPFNSCISVNDVKELKKRLWETGSGISLLLYRSIQKESMAMV